MMKELNKLYYENSLLGISTCNTKLKIIMKRK